MNKVLSIIIPTYNMEKYLRKCLDSLIVSDENLQKLEVLVINDGSKDSSSQIAYEYEAKYPQTFRVIDKENGNYGSCINRGMKEATGKYVKILDADDYYNRVVFDHFIFFLQKRDVDVVISDFNIVDEYGNCLSEFTYNLPTDQFFNLCDIPTEMTPFLIHHAITYKRELFSRFIYKQTEGISYTDDEWIFKPMMWVNTAQYFPETLYMYLRGREGQTFDPKVLKRSLEQRIEVIKEMTRFYEENAPLCFSQNFSFVTEKLERRITPLYMYHLILYPSSINRKRIKVFDSYLSEVSPTIFHSLNTVKSKKGWHYIRQWRAMNYSYWTPMLIAMRFKWNIRKCFVSTEVQIDRIPDDLKRKTK